MVAEFPSPLGELYFLIEVLNFYVESIEVSVPSRGAIFLNANVGMLGSLKNRFRPLSGSYIS